MGCHRSGTSAIAGSCHDLGFTFGSHLLAVSPDNPKGYFEKYEVLKLNDGLMTLVYGDWASPLRAEQADFATLAERPYTAQLLSEIKDSIKDVLESGTNWAIKDPRISRLLPFWQTLTPADAGYLLVLRHPVETMASMIKRDGFGDLQASIVWLLHTIDPIRFALDNDLPLHFIDFAQSMKDSGLVSRRLTEMGFDISQNSSSFIDPGLQRNFLPQSRSATPLEQIAEALFMALIQFSSVSDKGFSDTVVPLMTRAEELIAEISAEKMIAEIIGTASVTQRELKARQNIEQRHSTHLLWLRISSIEDQIAKVTKQNEELWPRTHKAEKERDTYLAENRELWKRIHSSEALHASTTVELSDVRRQLAVIKKSKTWRFLGKIFAIERRFRKP